MYQPINKEDNRRYPVPVYDSHLPAVETREPFPVLERSPGIRDFLDILLRRKWWIATFVIFVFVPTLFYSLTAKPVYKALGFIEVNPDAKVTKFEEVVSSRFDEKGGFIQTQIELMQSPALGRRIIEKLHLESHPAFNPLLSQSKEREGAFVKFKSAVANLKSDITDKVKQWLNIKKEPDVPLDPALVKIRQQKILEAVFVQGLQVEPKEDTNIISIAFDSTDPTLASDIVNALIHEFTDWQMDRRIDSSSTAKQQLEKRIEVARSQLKDADSELSDFAKKSGIVSLDSKLNIVYQQLEQINAALAKAEADRIAKSEFYNQAKSSDINSLSFVMQNTLILNLKDRYITLMAEYEKLRVIYRDDYPTVKNLRAQITDIGRKIEAEQQKILNSAKNDYLTALKTEQALQSTAEEKKTMALRINELASQYKIMERDVEINKQIYQSLLERSKEIDANVGTDLGNTKVVDFASLPLVPYKPDVQRNLLLALMVGLIGGTALALFREHLDDTVKRVDDISEQYWIPILGVIPTAKKNELDYLDSLVRMNPSSIFSEAVRFAQTSIELGSSKEHPIRSMLITSTNAGAGKTTVSANLAQAFAASEEKVVLIDVDLRRPRLHGSFTTDGESCKGLSHYLRGMCSLEEVLQQTEVPNLIFISSGSIPHNPAELLSSNRMRSLLENLNQRFDRVILDAPPYGVFGDVLFLGHKVDAVILVATLGQTQREALRTFRRSFSSSNGQLVGCIVNKLDINNRYGSYYEESYRAYSSYGYKHDKIPTKMDLTH